MQMPEQVAKELVKALEKRKKAKVVSGFPSRMMLLVQKLMSRNMVVSMMAGYGPLKDDK